MDCQSCDVEKECGYQYKPCDCFNYRKFKPLPEGRRLETQRANQQTAQILQFKSPSSGRISSR